jgi:hypothetical protein
MPSPGMLRRVALAKPTFRWKGSSNSVRRLLVTANVVPSSPNLVTMIIEALRSSEASAIIRTTRRNIPEDGFLQCGVCSQSASYTSFGSMDVNIDTEIGNGNVLH